LKSIVDKVLSIATPDAVQDSLSFTSFDLKQLIENTVDSLKLHLEKHNSKISITTTGSNFTLLADKVHLTNLLQNLIDNAIKYSKENPKIDIHLIEKPNQLEIKIEDQGIGIPKAYQSQIFDRFFRVPQNDRHDVKGHGLGLHYVKSVIDQHKGSIELLPSEIGTTFLIKIPKHYD